jgi:hypothetical protein
MPSPSSSPDAKAVASDPGTRPAAKLAAFITPAALTRGPALPSTRWIMPRLASATYTSPASSSPNVVMPKPELASTRVAHPVPCRSTPQMRPLQKSPYRYVPRKPGERAPRYTNPPVTEQPCARGYSDTGSTSPCMLQFGRKQWAPSIGFHP